MIWLLFYGPWLATCQNKRLGFAVTTAFVAIHYSVKPAEFYEDHSKQMDDEYVQVFLWQNQVAHLPDVEYEPVGKNSLKIFPVVGRVVKGIFASAFNPRGLLRYFLERNIRDAFVDLVQRFYL